MFRSLCFLGLGVVMLLSACGGTGPAATPQTYTVVSEATIKPGDAVPPPTDPVVLSLTGQIGQTNVEGRLDFDMKTLEQLGVIEFKVNDPYLKALTTYRGVLLQDVVKVARVPDDVTMVNAIALNDYEAIGSLTEMLQWPVMIATFRNGERMPVAEKGPMEIIFPYDDYPIDRVKYDSLWVWQLRSLDFRKK